MAEDKIIKTQDQLRNVLEGRQAKAALKQVNDDACPSVNHAAVASQVIKVVNSIRMDPFIQKVMTLRVIGPLVTGHERTHLSIALELGASVDDVEQAEAAGIEIVNNLLQKVATPEFIEKFNRNRVAENLIRSEISKKGNG